MNKEYITKFLATEVLDLEEFVVQYRSGDRSQWMSKEQAALRLAGGNGTLTFRESEFDPINNIAHAFMVQDAIAKMGDKIIKIYSIVLEESVIGKWNLTEYGVVFPAKLFEIINATAEQRSIAAFRALATEEQIAESGL